MRAKIRTHHRAPWMRDSADPMVTLAASRFFFDDVGSLWCEVHLLRLFEGGAAANMVVGAVQKWRFSCEAATLVSLRRR